MTIQVALLQSQQQVIALVEPLESIKKMYLEKTNGSSNQTDSSNDGTESDKSD